MAVVQPIRQQTEDLAAERAVLGAVLADNTVVASVAEVVLADDFSSPAHAQIFAAMLALDGTQRPVDHLTLSEELKTRGQLAGVGGPAYLMTLDQVVPLASSAVEYARIVKDQSVRRRLANVGREILELASQDTGELRPSSTRPSAAFSSWRSASARGAEPVRELMERTLDLLDRMKMSSSGVTGLSTGFVDLDLQLTGLHPGELLILAARPGVGKTSLAMNVAMHVALKEERPVGIFSLEMPAISSSCACWPSAARVDMKKLRAAAHAARRGEVPGGRGQPLQRAALHRRHRSPLPLRPPGQGAPAEAEEPGPGSAGGGLPPADAPEGQGGEPAAGGERDQPLAEGPGQGAGGAHPRPEPAEPEGRGAQGRPADALRPRESAPSSRTPTW
jgi:hypothetical protein